MPMKFQVFDLFGPISNLGFLSTYKFACDTNVVQEGVAFGFYII